MASYIKVNNGDLVSCLDFEDDALLPLIVAMLKCCSRLHIYIATLHLVTIDDHYNYIARYYHSYI